MRLSKMDKQQLREQLEQLHAELAQVETLDGTDAEMLRHLASDIREILEREETHAGHYSGLGEQLKEAVARLEASHPRTTEAMRQVIDQLAYLGI
jgi:NAD-specific glutamate dehydrogenase